MYCTQKMKSETEFLDCLYQIKCVFRPKRDAGTSSDGPVIQSESKIRRQEKIPGGTGCRYT